jgi:hypothetical protein
MPFSTLGKRSNICLSDSVCAVLVSGVVADGRTHPVNRHPAKTIAHKCFIISPIAKRAVQPEPGFPAIGWDAWFCVSVLPNFDMPTMSTQKPAIRNQYTTLSEVDRGLPAKKPDQTKAKINKCPSGCAEISDSATAKSRRPFAIATAHATSRMPDSNIN